MATQQVVEKVYALLAGSKPAADLTKVDIPTCVLVLEPVDDELLEAAAVLIAHDVRIQAREQKGVGTLRRDMVGQPLHVAGKHEKPVPQAFDTHCHQIGLQ